MTNMWLVIELTRLELTVTTFQSRRCGQVGSQKTRITSIEKQVNLEAGFYAETRKHEC